MKISGNSARQPIVVYNAHDFDIIFMIVYWTTKTPYKSLLIVLFSTSITADLQNSGLQIHIEEIFGCYQVSCGSWELEGHFLLVGFLLGQGLHLISHLFVGLEQLIQLTFLSLQFFIEVGLFIGLKFESWLMIDFQVINSECERGLNKTIITSSLFFCSSSI